MKLYKEKMYFLFMYFESFFLSEF